MHITWTQAAGFVVVSASIFVIGLMRGEYTVRQRISERDRRAITEYESEGNVSSTLTDEDDLSEAEATFVNEVPAYARRSGQEFYAGKHRDLFGLPMRIKTLYSSDQPGEVIAWYERVFLMKSYNVYKVDSRNGLFNEDNHVVVDAHPGARADGDSIASLAAVDTYRKQIYCISASRSERSKSTQISVAWIDGTKPQDVKPRMIPLVMEDATPMLISGDGKVHEMAIYFVDGTPDQAYSRYQKQLQDRGWELEQAPSAEIDKELNTKIQTYTKANQTFTLSARDDGSRTVLLCQVTPRAG